MELRLINFKEDVVNESSLDLINFTVSDKIFRCSFNAALVRQVVSSYLTNSRQGTSAQKNRSAVSGSNRKPWRQKGTGRARSGSVKSPIWRSGGVTFASSPKEYNQKVNKKMYKGAMRSILSNLACNNRLFIIKNFFIEQPKTKLLLEKLKFIDLKNKSLLIFTDFLDKNLFLASRNVHKIEIYDFIHMNPVNLINCNITLISYKIIRNIEQRLV